MQTLWDWLLRLLAWLRRVVRRRSWLASGCPRWKRIRISHPARRFRAHPKPAWVRDEIIRLKALMPEAGCRTDSNCFLRRRTRAARWDPKTLFEDDEIVGAGG
jgi:hypothetical protein